MVMDSGKKPCPICGYKDGLSNIFNVHGAYAYEVEIICPCCGHYGYPTTYPMLHRFGPGHVVKNTEGYQLTAFIGLTRENAIHDSGSELYEIKNIKDFVEYSITQAPVTVSDKIDRLVMNLSRMSTYYGDVIEILNDRDYPLGYCKNAYELASLIEYLTSSKKQYLLLKGPGYYLSVDGWDRVRELITHSVLSSQCFVAIWFTKEMLGIYNNHISKAMKKAGYKPLIATESKHDDEVTTQILAEIRKSKFVIADFTGQREGVYFEAGFAKGLGLNVIWTCKEDWFDNDRAEIEGEYIKDGQWEKGKVKEKRYTHFDVNHRQFIIWDKPEQLENDIYHSIIEQFGEGPIKDDSNEKPDK